MKIWKFPTVLAVGLLLSIKPVLASQEHRNPDNATYSVAATCEERTAEIAYTLSHFSEKPFTIERFQLRDISGKTFEYAIVDLPTGFTAIERPFVHAVTPICNPSGSISFSFEIVEIGQLASEPDRRELGVSKLYFELGLDGDPQIQFIEAQ